MEKSYSDVLSVKPVKDMKAQPGAGKEVKHENIIISKKLPYTSDQRRFREIKRRKMCHHNRKVHEVLNKLGVKPQIEGKKRLGNSAKSASSQELY